jgi:hypothetical protein
MAVAIAVGMVFVAGALGTAPQTAGQVQLDKNLHNTLSVYHLGSLNGQLNSTTGTALDICERTPTLPGDTLPSVGPANFTILVDGEQMTVTNVAAKKAASGGCKFTDPADTAADTTTYTVVRAQNGTTATSHPGASDVTRLVTETKSGTDWNIVYNAVQNHGSDKNPCATDIINSVACDWLNDPPGQSIFTLGSSDTANITGWHWTDSSVPDADEILHAYAIKFSNSLLYFGADRFAVNGAKDMGFWFFKSSVTAKADGTFVDDTGAPAVHQIGDILALGTFSQGGAVTTIRVFKWVGTGGSDGSLDVQGNFPDCVPGSGTASGCNTVNNTTIPSPWLYVGKSAVAPNVIYGGGMMEGGIDLGALGLTGCFASFMAETRSSPSLTAAQKDFTLGRFESCGATLVTTPQDGSGTNVGSGGLDLGTGVTGVTAKDSAVLTVNGTTSFTGSVNFFICGPIAESATCPTGGVPAGTTSVTASGTYASDTVKLTKAANNTTGAPGRYCWRGEFTSTTPGLTAGAKDSTTTECFHVNPVTPTLSTTAVDCTASHTALSGAVAFPGPFCDKAVLGGTANKAATNGVNATYPSILTGNPLPASNGAVATGTITFTLVGPDTNVTVCSPATVVATGTNPQTPTVSGNDSYFTTGVTVSSPGVYHWKASYSGDDPNTLAKAHNAACDQTPEDVTVQQIDSAISTGPYTYPQDSASIKSSVVGDKLPAGGTVVFKLFDSSANCTANGTTGLVFSETKTDVVASGGANEVTGINTNNTTFKVDSSNSKTYYWRVTYTTGDSAHTSRQSACTESTAVTQTDAAYPGTLFTPAP